MIRAMASKLCSVCDSVFQAFRDRHDEATLKPQSLKHSPSWRFKYHDCLQLVSDAAVSGCDLCYSLLRASSLDLEDLKRRTPRFASDYLTIGAAVRYPGKSGHFQITWARKSSNSLLISRLLCQPELPKCFFHDVGSSTDSDTSWQTITTWFKDCVNNHPECSSAKQDHLPTRLLSVKDNVVKLCETSTLPRTTKFATLSYSWGNEDSLKLLQSNVKSFQRCLPYAKLGKTYTDAIKATQELGISYLWIDALCIIQDSPKDWSHEAPLMSTVYGNSFLNIAASGGENPNAGLFFAREVRDVKAVRVHMDNRTPQSMHTILLPIKWTCVTGILGSRAWTFQERFLAHRSLHYTQSQVFWECKTQRLASESSPSGVSERFLENSGQDHSLRRKPAKLWEAQELWHNIVGIYSRGRLTYGRDKLVALSGVADWFDDTIKYLPALRTQGVHQTASSVSGKSYPYGDYLAGIQLSNLPKSLCWKLDTSGENDNLPKFPASCIAPSWSWASQNWPVTFLQHDIKAYPNGPRDEPYIKFIQAKLSFTTTSGEVFQGGDHVQSMQIKCRRLLRGDWDSKLVNTHGLSALGEQMMPNEGLASISWDNGDEKETVAYLLPTYKNVRKYAFLYGIMIKPAFDASGKLCWRRVGHFNMRLMVKHRHLCPWESLLDYFLSEEPKMKATAAGYELPQPPEESVYEDVAGKDEKGNKLYIITLI